MAQFRLSPQAEEDIEAILAWSHGQFGEQIRRRYEELIVQAMLDLASNPTRAGTRQRPELGNGVSTYHIRYSRDRVTRSAGRIRKPRHFLIFRVAADGCLEISRVLHDSLDLERHLPPDYPSADPEADE
jgi:toxin ParE1/3/4